MEKTIAFYDPYTTGHHIEYLFHIISYKIKHNINANFILYTSKFFSTSIIQLIEISEIENANIEIIHIESLISDSEFKTVQTLENYKKQLNALSKEIKLKKIDHCVFMYMDNALQIALGIYYRKKLGCDFSGILLNPFGGYGRGVYKFYNTLRRILQNYIMISNNKMLSSIYIITNEKTSRQLNLMHLTNKFKFVSDPILDFRTIFKEELINSRPKTQTTFLLFGSLNKRKGLFKTLQILKKIDLNYLARIKIIFAGKIAETDKREFLSEYKIIKSKKIDSIEVIDEFIPYRKVPEIFNNADYILLPYDTTQASSGVLGYAAYFKKPIIGQGGGILGKHVANYKLGLTIEKLDDRKLLDIIIGVINGNIKIDYEVNGMERYAHSRNGAYFASTIIESARKLNE